MIPTQAVILSIDDLNEACTRWKERLGIVDWTIKLSIVRQWAFGDGSVTIGNCEVLEQDRLAIIKLLDPIDYEANSKYYEYDMEFVLVHEMLHIWFDVATIERNVTGQEQAINAIAGSLIRENRQKGRNKK